MADLRARPQWKHLQALLERVAQSEYDRLANNPNPDYDHYLMQLGAYQACERATRMVDEILDKVKDTDDRAESGRQHAADHRKLVTYATPHWKPYT